MEIGQQNSKLMKYLIPLILGVILAFYAHAFGNKLANDLQESFSSVSLILFLVIIGLSWFLATIFWGERFPSIRTITSEVFYSLYCAIIPPFFLSFIAYLRFSQDYLFVLWLCFAVLLIIAWTMAECIANPAESGPVGKWLISFWNKLPPRIQQVISIFFPLVPLLFLFYGPLVK